MALLHPEGRSVASIRVDTFCEGYQLSKAAYVALEAAHPEIRDYLESVAKLRLKRQASVDREALATAGGGGLLDDPARRTSFLEEQSVTTLFATMHLGETQHDKLRRQVAAKRASCIGGHNDAAADSSFSFPRRPPGMMKRQQSMSPGMLKRQMTQALSGRKGAIDDSDSPSRMERLTGRFFGGLGGIGGRKTRCASTTSEQDDADAIKAFQASCQRADDPDQAVSV
jgi:hypothetical protein